MSVKIIKGQKADVTKNNPGLTSVVCGIGWQGSAGIDIDFSAFLLGGGGKVSGDEDLIFYGNPSGAAGAVQLVQSAKTSYLGLTDKEQVRLKLSDVPAKVERIAFALTIYEGENRRQSFKDLNGLYIRLIANDGDNELIRFDLDNSFSVETAIVVGELYRYNGDWKFNAIASGYSGGLGALCGSFGIEVKEPEAAPPPPKQDTPPVPVQSAPANPQPAPPASPPPSPPVNLSKISLKKRGDTINLQKKAGKLEEILINLNWNQQKKKAGLFGSSGKGVDLDLGCLFELKDGYKGVVQALGNSFGSLKDEPYIALDGDDRTGAVLTGENLRINGNKIAEIKRILVFAFIYEGVANWAQADGVATIKHAGGPDIEVRMDEHNNRKGMCAIAMIENVNDETFSIKRLVEYFDGHRKLDEAYRWGMRWTAGSK
ncbi:TerD family protein [Cohnella fermenti]|uniref:Tellurium resistance protein TerA n=1 Tax=Cohnella fermenti TaxID=2565925 RepID=A0A4S4C925_9BACL|nr:TerD family protein [Cohnella fermenti]THF84531.1 tellurium resistance protein TerA [Cohnella fermenti]